MAAGQEERVLSGWVGVGQARAPEMVRARVVAGRQAAVVGWMPKKELVILASPCLNARYLCEQLTNVHVGTLKQSHSPLLRERHAKKKETIPRGRSKSIDATFV